MKFAWLGCLLYGSLVFARTQDAEINVNSRYTVDAVIVAGNGWRTSLPSEDNEKISTGLRRDLMSLIGAKLNPPILDTLGSRLKQELSAREVTHRVVRAQSPEHVSVEFDVKPARGSLDVNVNQFVYQSKQGWSGKGEAGFTIDQNSFAFGLASDGDSLPERYAGISARYENKRVVAERLGMRFQFESYHQQWSRNTLDALESAPEVTSGPYRSRQNFEPTATVYLASPLTLEVGARFERYESQGPSSRTEGSNAVIAAVRYHRQFPAQELRHEVQASYRAQFASRVLSSDYVFASHTAALQYALRYGKHEVMDVLEAGLISGRAPLNRRLLAGNSYRLRGWNKQDLDPIGGNRMISNSVEYRYGVFKVFYDTGAIWDEGQPAIPRHSLGVGLRASIFTLAVAFPVRAGHTEPIVMMGMIY